MMSKERTPEMNLSDQILLFGVAILVFGLMYVVSVFVA